MTQIVADSIPDELPFEFEEQPTVQRLQLEPGDVIVLSYPGAIPYVERERIISTIKTLFPEHRALVLDNGLTISTVRPGE